MLSIEYILGIQRMLDQTGGRPGGFHDDAPTLGAVLRSTEVRVPMQPITSYTVERHEFAGVDPGVPPPGVMFVFVADGKPVMVDFRCPCGCGATVPTHLGLPSPRHWEYSDGPNGPTLSPSIRFTGGCKAHFTITDGRVKMHSDSGK